VSQRPFGRGCRSQNRARQRGQTQQAVRAHRLQIFAALPKGGGGYRERRGEGRLCGRNQIRPLQGGGSAGVKNTLSAARDFERPVKVKVNVIAAVGLVGDNNDYVKKRSLKINGFGARQPKVNQRNGARVQPVALKTNKREN
jgi:hypothetical protein